MAREYYSPLDAPVKDTGEWLDTQMEAKHPATAAEYVDEVSGDDIETAARKLAFLKDENLMMNISHLNENRRKACRRMAVVFLVRYLENNQVFTGFPGQDPEQLLDFAKNILIQTREFKKDIPSAGLETIFQERQVA